MVDVFLEVVRVSASFISRVACGVLVVDAVLLVVVVDGRRLRFNVVVIDDSPCRAWCSCCWTVDDDDDVTEIGCTKLRDIIIHL